MSNVEAIIDIEGVYIYMQSLYFVLVKFKFAGLYQTMIRHESPLDDIYTRSDFIKNKTATSDLKFKKQ